MRTWKDIKRITILTEVQGIHGWVLDIAYKDAKQAAGLILDYGDKDEDMLKVAFKMIDKQLRSKQSANS